MTIDAALAHADEVTSTQLVMVRAARRSWTMVDPEWISESWNEALDSLTEAMSAAQVRVAAAGAEYGAAALAEQGLYVAPQGFVNPAAFGGGYAPDGRTLRGLLYSPATASKTLIGGGVAVPDALTAAGLRLDRIVKSVLADTARQAASVDIAARPKVGYIRQLVGTSCPDCLMLAGRFYRWNAGFLRHPGDDCVHVPTTQAAASGVTVDPYAHFNAMTEAEQDEFWGAANAQAIRDGADIYRVWNARRSMTKTGMFTLAGTSTRGPVQLAPRQRRMTPEAIYRVHPNRADAMQALVQHGYILPGGQVPGGSIRGPYYEGFGALGAGGRRTAASEAVMQARLTGVRDPNVRYTMTAAERRLHDATVAWEEVLAGRNPWQSPGFTNVPDPTGRRRTTASGSAAPLTPQVAAAVERNYRRWLATGGEIFTR